MGKQSRVLTKGRHSGLMSRIAFRTAFRTISARKCDSRARKKKKAAENLATFCGVKASGNSVFLLHDSRSFKSDPLASSASPAPHACISGGNSWILPVSFLYVTRFPAIPLATSMNRSPSFFTVPSACRRSLYRNACSSR